MAAAAVTPAATSSAGGRRVTEGQHAGELEGHVGERPLASAKCLNSAAEIDDGETLSAPTMKSSGEIIEIGSVGAKCLDRRQHRGSGRHRR